VSEFHDDFDGASLDTSVWVPHYLPAWSSRESTQATFRITDSQLTLVVPKSARRWCADEHPEPLRVSGIQSGNHSGPVGSSRGQQPFVIDQRVREEQPLQQGWLPARGRVAVRCAMKLSHRSMAAVWLSGFEEVPEESGEICLVEVFGRSIRSDVSAEFGVGIKAKSDPNLVEEFIAPRRHIDVAEPHTYSVEWTGQSATFCIDETTVHTSNRSPAYPLQVMIAVFDFPRWTDGNDHDREPTLVVDWISGRSSPGG
jgi:Glycosyl hydrolases family 16